MQITPDGAYKLILKLENDKKSLIERIDKVSTFVVAVSEGDPEELRPDFDLKSTVEEIKQIEEKIIKIKHQRNLFNATTVLPETEMTIDEALVKMAVLNREYSRYVAMGRAESKERVVAFGNSKVDIEYRYTNYPIEVAKKIGDQVYTELQKIQTGLNRVNSTYTFEIPDDM